MTHLADLVLRCSVDSLLPVSYIDARNPSVEYSVYKILSACVYPFHHVIRCIPVLFKPNNDYTHYLRLKKLYN